MSAIEILAISAFSRWEIKALSSDFEIDCGFSHNTILSYRSPQDSACRITCVGWFGFLREVVSGRTTTFGLYLFPISLEITTAGRKPRCTDPDPLNCTIYISPICGCVCVVPDRIALLIKNSSHLIGVGDDYGSMVAKI